MLLALPIPALLVGSLTLIAYNIRLVISVAETGTILDILQFENAR